MSANPNSRRAACFVSRKGKAFLTFRIAVVLASLGITTWALAALNAENVGINPSHHDDPKANSRTMTGISLSVVSLTATDEKHGAQYALAKKAQPLTTPSTEKAPKSDAPTQKTDQSFVNSGEGLNEQSNSRDSNEPSTEDTISSRPVSTDDPHSDDLQSGDLHPNAPHSDHLNSDHIYSETAPEDLIENNAQANRQSGEVVNQTNTTTSSRPQEELAVVTEASHPLVSTATFLEPPNHPRYPSIARKRGQEGVVWLEVWLDEDGQQTELLIKESSGVRTLDQAALRAVKNWKFKPYRHNGLTIAARMQIPIEFSLN